MGPNNFTEQDKDNLIKFVNFVGNKATFNQLNTIEILEYFGLLSFIQKSLIPKIDSHILELQSITEEKEHNAKEKGE